MKHVLVAGIFLLFINVISCSKSDGSNPPVIPPHDTTVIVTPPDTTIAPPKDTATAPPKDTSGTGATQGSRKFLAAERIELYMTKDISTVQLNVSQVGVFQKVYTNVASSNLQFKFVPYAANASVIMTPFDDRSSFMDYGHSFQGKPSDLTAEKAEKCDRLQVIEGADTTDYIPTQVGDKFDATKWTVLDQKAGDGYIQTDSTFRAVIATTPFKLN